MEATIWSKNNCPYCVMAKEMLDVFDINYQEKVIGEGYSKEQFLQSNPGASTVPQIYIDGQYIGGYEELVQYIKNV